MWMQSADNMEQKNPFVPKADNIFAIRIKGYLDSRWSEWLEGLDFTLFDNGETILTGTIVDQSALMGILSKLHRLNLAILSFNKLDK